MADNDNKTHAQRAEENAVRRLGEAIGFGRIMQLAGKLWGETLVRLGHPPGGEFAIGPCVAFMVACPCPEDGRDDNGHCEWCCGAGQVTERVRAAMGQPRAARPAATAIASGWRKAPPTVEEVLECRWWWVRWPGERPAPLDLEHFDCSVWRADAEYAPCLAPSEGGRTP